jgi:hypothetical protein
LVRLRQELRLVNRSAAAGLEEGLEETLTLHRLGVSGAWASASRRPTAWSRSTLNSDN